MDSLYGYLLLAEYTYSNSKAGVYNLSSQENNKLKAKEIAELFQEFGNKELKIKTSTNKQFEEVSRIKNRFKQSRKRLRMASKIQYRNMCEVNTRLGREYKKKISTILKSKSKTF